MAKNRSLPSVLLLLALLVSPAAPAADDDAVIGAWRGSLAYVRPDGAAQNVYFGVNLAREDGALSGAVSAYQIGVGAPLASVETSGARVTATLPLHGETARLTLVASNRDMNGSLQWQDHTMAVALHKLHRGIDESAVAARTGIYTFDDDDEDALIISPAGWTYNVYSSDGRYRTFFPVSDDDAIAGEFGFLPTPVRSRLHFSDGRQVRLTQNGSSRTARLSRSVIEEAVRFRNGGVELAGTLLRPAAATTPTPGLVVVWGSGQQNRFGFSGLVYYRAAWFARRGFATLIYDKRGVGDSGGSYESRSMDLLAGDMSAAVTALGEHALVDAGKVGLLVHSQSGIYVPSTILADSAVRFAAVIGTTVVNGEIQEIERTRQQLAADGWPQADIDEAVATQILKFYYADKRIGWDAYVRQHQRVVDRPWFEPVIGSTTDKGDSSWDFWRDGNRYEPADHWAKVGIPVLFLYGDRDTISPVQMSLDLLEQAFAGDRASLLTTRIYAGAEHSLFEARQGGVLEEAEFTQLVPYLEDVEAWLAEQDVRGQQR